VPTAITAPCSAGGAIEKFGLVKDYWTATGSDKVDVGRFEVTRDETDRYKFRVPMLRNIAKTAPYFHDGSVAKLDEAVQIMADVQLGQRLSDQDAAAIVSFFAADGASRRPNVAKSLIRFPPTPHSGCGASGNRVR
jgi:cytochrome c peroxidase